MSTPDPATTPWVPLWPLGVDAVPLSQKGQPSGVATLDSSGLIPAAQLPGAGVSAYAKIADSLLAANATSIDFSSIPQTFKHLMLYWATRASTSGQKEMLLNFNGDGTAANYAGQGYSASGTGIGAATLTQMRCGLAAGSDSPAGRFTNGFTVIPAYTSTAFGKTAIAECLSWTSATLVAATDMVWWITTAAINRLTLTLGSGQFVAGTYFGLYGIS